MRFSAWLLASAVLFSQTATAQTPTVNWVQWTAPSTYPTALTGSYRYTTNISGTLAIPPSGPTITVTLDGEVISASCFDVIANCTDTWWKNTAQGWPGYPATTFISANVPNLPTPSGMMIAQTGLADPQHTMVFSQPVTNIMMDIMSLGGEPGGAGSMSSYTFTQDFVILSRDPRCNGTPTGAYCLYKDGNTLTGYGGSGTIEFVGTYSSIEWTVSVPEIYSGFAIGVTSATAPATFALQSQWTGAAAAGDTLSIATGGTAPQVTLNSAAQSGGNTVTADAVILQSGNTVTLPAPTYGGTNVDSYTTTVSCANTDTNGRTTLIALTGTGGTFPYSFTVDDTTGQVVCTYVSSALPALILRSQWGGAAMSGDTMSVTTSGDVSAVLNATALNITTGAAVILQSGNAVTLPAPTYGSANIDNYTASVSCTNTDASGNTTPITLTDTGGTFPYSFTADGTTDQVICTYVSDGVIPALILQSQWNGAVTAGDTLSITTGGSAPATLNSTAPTAATATAVPQQSGNTVILPAPDYASGNGGRYTASVSCTNTDAGGNTTSLTLTGSDFPYSFTVNGTTGQVVCTYVSRAQSAPQVDSAQPVPASNRALITLLGLLLAGWSVTTLRRTPWDR